MKILILILVFIRTNILCTTMDSLEHEITKVEQICHGTDNRWNGCPPNTLVGWQNHSDRLQRWYQFLKPDKLHLNYLSFLRYKLKEKNRGNYETVIYLNYAPLFYARACQLRRSMSPYQRFQRLLVWVMTHQMNPIRSGTIRPYFIQILTLEIMLSRKKDELSSVCFKRSHDYK